MRLGVDSGKPVRKFTLAQHCGETAGEAANRQGHGPTQQGASPCADEFGGLDPSLLSCLLDISDPLRVQNGLAHYVTRARRREVRTDDEDVLRTGGDVPTCR